MFTLRVLPPAFFLMRGVPGQDVRLRALYYERLWRGWRGIDRVGGALLAAGHGLGAVVAWLKTPHRGLAQGFLPREQAQAAARLADPGRLDSYVRMAERKGIHRLLNAGAYPLASNPLKNKLLFADRCAAAGLPTAPSFQGDIAALRPWVQATPSIIVKPNYSSKGVGVRKYDRSQGEWRQDQRPLSEAAVVVALMAALRQGAVVQQCLTTHPALEVMSPGALPTLRVLTCLDENGRPEVVGVLMRLSADAANPVDNFNHGNFVTAVDRATGTLGPAYRAGPHGALAESRMHPATGAPIAGVPVPDLGQALDLAIGAHHVFREGFTVVGWDIGLTDVGPVLIEGNWNPGTDVLQLALGVGLDQTRMGALYRHHLSDLPADAWRTARPIQLEPKRAARRTRR